MRVIRYEWWKVDRENRIVYMPWWLTPNFCARKLNELYKFLEAKKRGAFTGTIARGHIREQIKRYESIVQEKDWNEERNYELVWVEPRIPKRITPQQLALFPDWERSLRRCLIRA
jgi:hypothetical protein